MATTAKSLQAIPAVSNGSIQTGQLTNGHATEGDPIVGQSPSQGLIAICGMALRLPAGIRTPQQLWEFLLAGGDARGRIPISRYNVAAFHDETGKHGTLITEYGYFLEDDIGALDTSFLCMPRMEVERIDPQQRLMLEVARECLEDAGEPAWGGKRIGCYIGSLGEDWCEMFARETQHWGPYRYTGFGNFALSKRISYEMDLQGPRFVRVYHLILVHSDIASMTTRTACSASLVAFHEACVAISRHDCDSAVVGGVNLIMTPGATMSMTEQNVLSRDGSCKTFSADADGYARGEAVTAIYIAVALSWDEVEKHLVGNVAIACDNSPKSVTISGDVDEVKTVIERIHRLQPDVSARKLQIDRAYHSYHMPEIGEQYYALLEGIVKARKPKKLFFSSVTGCLWDDNAILDSHYWQRNLERPVMFRGAVSSILQHPVGKHPVFLDIGPHSALGGPLRQILAQESSRAPYASALSRNQNCVESLLSATGMLWTLQIPIALDELMPTGLCLSDLPPYPWDHEESYWYETRLSKDYRLRKYPHHDLLGVKVVECTDFEPSWRNHFHLNTAPWVRDHRVGEDIVFPFAAYVAMAGEAIRQIAGIDQTFRLRHIIVSTALVIAEGKPTEMITTLRPHRLTDTLNSKWWEFVIASHNGHTWTKHCTGEVMAQAEPLGRSSNPETLPRRVDASKWFDVLQRAGLDLGPEFGKIGVMSAGTIRQQATGEMLNERQDKTSKYHIHPTVIDGALQLVGVAFAKSRIDCR